MKTQTELRTQLKQIDHKGYKAYKVLEGEYDFGVYRLCRAGKHYEPRDDFAGLSEQRPGPVRCNPVGLLPILGYADH